MGAGPCPDAPFQLELLNSELPHKSMAQAVAAMQGQAQTQQQPGEGCDADAGAGAMEADENAGQPSLGKAGAGVASKRPQKKVRNKA